MGKEKDDVKIRKVKALEYRAREKAKGMGLEDDDLVKVKTIISSTTLPRYEFEKIDDSPTEYIKNTMKEEEVSKNG